MQYAVIHPTGNESAMFLKSGNDQNDVLARARQQAGDRLELVHIGDSPEATVVEYIRLTEQQHLGVSDPRVQEILGLTGWGLSST